jgi:protein tyrosine phosphatase (PTP) superfamily phosphohydrolase (DUF442 family)
VKQYHYTSWPDHGVPEYATSVLSFHKRVTSQHKASKGPILVHCRYNRSMVCYTNIHAEENKKTEVVAKTE